MRRRAAIFVLLVVSLTVWAACARVAKRNTDPLAGEFAGTFAPHGGQAVKAAAKVIADMDNNYRVVILYPAAAAKATRIELSGRGNDGGISVVSKNWAGKPVDVNWSGTITADELHIAANETAGGTAEMKRVEQKTSPTLGEKPPAGAIVLLPFEEGRPTNLDQWTNQEWLCQPDGSVQVHRGDNRTKKEFGSFQLHLEFFVPLLPVVRGESRGRSGVFLQNSYEVAIVDSFGLPISDHACGAFSGRQAPLVDASLPPGQWQTFDITLKAPQFSEISGLQSRGAIITVLLNGVKVQHAVEARGVTSGALSLPNKKGPLRLQDHNDPVRFRNIWLVEQK